MITKIRNNKCLAVAIAFTAALLIGCDDDPGVENYYTAKGDMANTYLTSRPETFSKFVDIINKSKLTCSALTALTRCLHLPTKQ